MDRLDAEQFAEKVIDNCSDFSIEDIKRSIVECLIKDDSGIVTFRELKEKFNSIKCEVRDFILG